MSRPGFGIVGTDFLIADVDEVWPRLSARSLRRSRTSHAVLQEILDGCRRGESLCLRCPDGVVIVGLVGTEGGGFEARCLLAVSSSSPGAFKRCQGAMLKLARALGADRLAFRTDRDGWGRLLGSEWEKHADAYVRRVP